MSFAKQTGELNDKTFKTFSFNSHVPAYIDGGIQYVPLDDLVRIICEPNLQEWMDIETLQQAIQVAELVYPKITMFVRLSARTANGVYYVIKNAQKIEEFFGKLVWWNH